eukprot:905692-Prorocentrum_minimum.AAC.6
MRLLRYNNLVATHLAVCATFLRGLRTQRVSTLHHDLRLDDVLRVSGARVPAVLPPICHSACGEQRPPEQ